MVLAIPRQALNQYLQDDNGFAARFYKAIGGFLADRLRSSTRYLGYGRVQDDKDEDTSEPLYPELMDASALGAKRFNYLLEQFRGS